MAETLFLHREIKHLRYRHPLVLRNKSNAKLAYRAGLKRANRICSNPRCLLLKANLYQLLMRKSVLAVVTVVLLQENMLCQQPALNQLFQIWGPCWSYLLSAIQEQTTTHCRFYSEQHWTHGHAGQLPGGPRAQGPLAYLCMLCTVCFSKV